MANATQGSKGHPPSISIVTETADAEMVCAHCPKARWCDHIQEYMRHHRDIKDWWSKRLPTISQAGTVEWHMQLPIIPSHGMWARAAVVQTDNGIWRLELHRQHQDPAQIEVIPVGITGSSEARAAWRLMIIDYWRGRVEVENPKCQSKGHSFKSQVEWTEALMLDSTDIKYHLNLWTAWYHKLCYRCWRVREKMESDIGSDLIPDDQKTTGWNNLRGRTTGQVIGTVVAPAGTLKAGTTVRFKGNMIHPATGGGIATQQEAQEIANKYLDKDSYELSGEYYYGD